MPSRAGLYAVVVLILGWAGPLDEVPQQVGILAGLAAWLAGARGRAGAGLLAAAPALLGVLLPGPIDARLAALVVACSLLPGPGRRADASFVAAALAHRILIARIAWLGSVELELSRILSGWVGWCTGQRIDFGPAASGLDLFVLFLIQIAAARLAGEAVSWRRPAAGAVAMVLFIALLPRLGRQAGLLPGVAGELLDLAGDHLEPQAQQVARVMFGWAAAFALLLALLLPAARRPREQPAPAQRRHAMLAGVAVALAMIVGQIGQSRETGPKREGEILFVKGQGSDLDVPSRDRLGVGRSGMYGMLPAYLWLDGHRVRIHEGALSEEALAGSRVVMLPLPTRGISGDERESIGRFLAQGGSLLVMADHTDLLGSMDPINALTGPWGLRARFDSAFPAVREWSGCLETPWPWRRKESGLGTGASLAITAPARPLILARYALSDAGDRANGGPGGFLGDYAYAPGEQLGNLALAGEARVGKGRVVLFGDTSSFQNVMLPWSYPFVAQLLDDLSRTPSATDRVIDAGLGLAAGLLGLLALGAGIGPCLALAGAILIPTAVAAVRPASDPLDRLPAGAPVARVDDAHLNALSRQLWRKDSIGGLLINLQRGGYLPVMAHQALDRRRLDPATLPVLIAPRRPLTRREVAALERHLEAGGRALVAAGPESSRALAPLLSPRGLRIGAMPLGPVPIGPDLDWAGLLAARGRAQFGQAWPVSSTGIVRHRSLYRAFEKDVVIEATWPGGGRLLLIGDPIFLTDQVLEDERGAWEGNVDFLASWLRERTR